MFPREREKKKFIFWLISKSIFFSPGPIRLGNRTTCDPEPGTDVATGRDSGPGRSGRDSGPGRYADSSRDPGARAQRLPQQHQGQGREPDHLVQTVCQARIALNFLHNKIIPLVLGTRHLFSFATKATRQLNRA